jgi:hypothetical protein
LALSGEYIAKDGLLSPVDKMDLGVCYHGEVFGYIQWNLIGSFFSYSWLKARGYSVPFPLLFVADGLSTLLRNKVNHNRITPIKVCRRVPGVSHLLFADNTLLFFRASVCVKNMLDVYATCTG